MSQIHLLEERSIDDSIHGFIPISYYANLIIDTKYFDRVRNIQQTGMAKVVYPCAEHSRKSHLLGTYFLSLRVLKKLSKVQPYLLIDEKDLLCVSIAALCHDIGHGPCSHTYDGPFLNAVNKNSGFTHEKASVELLKMIFKNYPHIKNEFDKVLDEKDYIFIYECINPKVPFMVDGKWIPKGRGKEKSFLYDVVSNVHTGIDVDKFDYFLRDTFFCNIKGSQFDVDVLQRIIDYSRVVYDSKLGYTRIGYALKIKNCINAVFETRKFLFQILYYHKTCLSYEHVLLKAWIEADKYLEFKTKNGEILKLSTIFKDWEVYSSVTENVVNALIEFYPDERLQKSKEILEKLKERHIPKRIYTLKGKNLKDMDEEFIKKWIIENCHKEFDEDKLFIKIRIIHGGKGLMKNPMDDVLFFNHKNYKNKNMVEEVVKEKLFMNV
ncbi:Deoxynucleoside triphosphate triphosphohydrolase SAMHD1 [Strongyloides ratti]|uniref:Deoxynucleoside triphosphate triphosphohydrolase SAMHD1 n=1 Tax=Strongyloides ratti TaxID=34506 RepID=A0A090L226_STRRB|nr:Deoxynucleoside triphosphate triphosphohydrolase SAMHD1 [Strongyloides ratti]CEF63866.1 Deoxynucleoside triphosphate triphosphohydrolase SAMHD1 [Strongyloides ratti]